MGTLCIPFEKHQRLALLLAFHPFLLTLAFAKFLDSLAKQGLAVVLRPFFHEGRAQVPLIAINHIIAQHSDVRFCVPSALLLGKHHWQAVGFKHRANHWHESWKVLV
jgi:hypothetical protein